MDVIRRTFVIGCCNERFDIPTAWRCIIRNPYVVAGHPAF
jgi:hypothetical protein